MPVGRVAFVCVCVCVLWVCVNIEKSNKDERVGKARAEIYRQRSKTESSLMAQNIFKSVSREVHGQDAEDIETLVFLKNSLERNNSYVKAML